MSWVAKMVGNVASCMPDGRPTREARAKAVQALVASWPLADAEVAAQVAYLALTLPEGKLVAVKSILEAVGQGRQFTLRGV